MRSTSGGGVGAITVSLSNQLFSLLFFVITFSLICILTSESDEGDCASSFNQHVAKLDGGTSSGVYILYNHYFVFALHRLSIKQYDVPGCILYVVKKEKGSR